MPTSRTSRSASQSMVSGANDANSSDQVVGAR